LSTVDDIAVLTSENVRLTYTLANLGSRALAFLADTLIIALIGLSLTFIFMSIGLSLGDIGAMFTGAESGAPFLAALFIVLMTILYWGYYFLFEWMNYGQTPGKKLLGIRVAMADGGTADIVACAVRNVIRLIDMLLAVFGITIFILIFTPKYQRLGDIVAGTVVVKLRRLSFSDVILAVRSADRAVETTAVENQSAGGNFRLSDAEMGLIERFLTRKDSIPEDVKIRLTKDLAARIRSKAYGISVDDLSDDELIQLAWSRTPKKT